MSFKNDKRPPVATVHKLKRVYPKYPPAVGYQGSHKNPAPETMEPDIVYAISINPAAQPEQHKLAEFFSDFEQNMRQIFKHASVEVVPELSANSRWHFHGLLQVHDIMEFFMNDLVDLRTQASFEIDTMADRAIWLTYVYKSRHLVETYLNKYKIRYLYVF